MIKRNSVLSVLMIAATLATAQLASADLKLNKNDHIAIIGNSLPDRMQHDAWLETYLQAANPDKQLVIRNLGLTGDRVASRPRNENFMNANDSLTLVEADVIFAFFGYNESFSQDPDKFKDELIEFIDHTRDQKYNGESAPQIVLFSPIAHENLNTPNVPDGVATNKWISTYSDAIASVARRKKVTFVDLYYPSEELYENTETPMTINGIHLNNEGNKQIAKLIIEELQGDAKLDNIDTIRDAVIEKNRTWFNRYRATDGNDVWGSRASLAFVDGQTNEVVLQHELVMLDIMTENRDRVIWSANKGRVIKPDDDNVPNPVMVKTNLVPAVQKREEGGGHKFVKPEDGAATLTLENGLTANLFASEQMFPEMVNPVQLDVDTKGRLWVAAWETYPKWQPDQEMLDRLLILPDDDHDGVADKAITFAFIHNPTAFTFWNGGVLVASAPDIWFLKDTDGDDIADFREIILTGLDSSDTHHSANGFDYGPDGYIYYQRGIFNTANIETPYRSPQLSGRSAMYRFNPRTFRFSHHADNPPNPHGGDFDYWGYHYATSATGGEAYQIRESGKGRFKMHELFKKTVRPVPSSGIISSTHFPEESNGNFIILNSIGFLGIKQYDLTNKEGIVTGKEVDDILVSSDSNFRPTDFKFGDDGAMYVADWSNPIIGHMQHNVRDPSRDHEHGRIYRITADGRPLQDHLEIDGQPIEALLEVLKHPTDGVRLRARIELSERDTDEVIAATEQWIYSLDAAKKEDAHHLLEALWLHQQHNVYNEGLLTALLHSPEPHARRAAQRVKYMLTIEGRFDEAEAPAAPELSDEELLASNYLDQDPSPDPKMVGDTLEVEIYTVKEQMRYDRTEFTVKAGSKVRLTLTNLDAMDHNLIMVQPGSAARVAVDAARLEAEGVKLQWKPENDSILFASNMLARDEKQTMEFTAPTTPGRYEYICTFPGHWQLMRGVMTVE
ncbi:MAG: PVC-type heme-binding CxxCH protein [Candidatus Hydrogenedentota bacterium]